MEVQNMDDRRSVRRLVLLGAMTSAVIMSSTAAMHALPASAGAAAIHKIRHVVIIMQENRSFDSYFGTYPGADGIPRDARGMPTVCVPDPHTGHCQRPYHDAH